MIHNFACTVLHVTLLSCSSGLRKSENRYALRPSMLLTIFLLYLALVKKILPIFDFTMLAGLLLYQLHWLPVEFGIKLKLTVFFVSRALSSAAAHQPIFIHLHLHVSNSFTFLHFYILCIDTVHI